MPCDPFTDLCWLTRPPADFAEQCRSARADPGALGFRVQTLASHALTSNQLLRLAKLIDEARADGHPLTPLTPFRLGLLGNGTLDLIVPALTASAARHGIALECVPGSYDQVLQEALSPELGDQSGATGRRGADARLSRPQSSRYACGASLCRGKRGGERRLSRLSQAGAATEFRRDIDRANHRPTARGAVRQFRSCAARHDTPSCRYTQSDNRGNACRHTRPLARCRRTGGDGGPGEMAFTLAMELGEIAVRRRIRPALCGSRRAHDRGLARQEPSLSRAGSRQYAVGGRDRGRRSRWHKPRSG